MAFGFGIDRLLSTGTDLERLRTARCALVAHPASVTSGCQHTLDALIDAGCNIRVAFGPQHGMRGDKQDNMIESGDYHDPARGVPVISLYGPRLSPSPGMLDDVDIVIFDLQDVGCRIYTYITTLRYFLDALAGTDKEIWVLDRPNPAGRPVDGLRLEPGQESFVGCDTLPTRHGLTVGELARWMAATNRLDVDLKTIAMTDYRISDAPGFGWPTGQRAWVNPSPNASSVNMARCFAGTVLIEGTELSEGRGTTMPLEVIGAPELPIDRLTTLLEREAPDWGRGVILRPCCFEPTFHKHVGKLCTGLQIHTDFDGYDHAAFTPYRLVAGLLKCLRLTDPGDEIWRNHEYEYEADRRPIDVINGGPGLRCWVDDPDAGFEVMEARLTREHAAWLDEREPFLVYGQVLESPPFGNRRGT